MEVIRNAYNISVVNPNRKGPAGRPRRRWQVYIKVNLTEITFKRIDLINLTRDRDQWVGCCERGNEPAGSMMTGKFLVPSDPASASG
jgi:hypothetical protein